MNNLLLSTNDRSKWFGNVKLFFAPVVLIYLGAASVNFQDGVQVSDFIPTIAVQGAMALYVVNAIMDYFRKLVK